MPRKLTVEQVQEARTRYAHQNESFADLARVFGVSPTSMRRAILGETYAKIPIAYKRPKTSVIE